MHSGAGAATVRGSVRVGSARRSVRRPVRRVRYRRNVLAALIVGSPAGERPAVAYDLSPEVLAALRKEVAAGDG